MKNRNFLGVMAIAAVWLLLVPHDSFAERPLSRSNRLLVRGFRTAIPSAKDFRNIPVREEGQLFINPVDVAAYGLNLHPGARVVRATVRAAAKR